MKALLQAVSELHEAELYDDLKFYVAFHLEEHLLDDELVESEQALLFKLIGDAHFQTDCFFQSVKVTLINYFLNNFVYFSSMNEH
jgi:hypothetical protein